MPEDKKIRFIKTFSNLPLNVRNEIIYVFSDKGPVTWNVAYLEISNDTLLGKEILEKLDSLDII
ncbi:hypothetical protein KJ980_01705 [Patescibacteria group bacterium]|nr:hypothetical protein [Patescibacteria group bacterium]MBU4016888.1 hypothetical protein [Patescibacteria group bacterium]MBU4098343.1 hypothetical protein [Patescibacteria group bacterium]